MLPELETSLLAGGPKPAQGLRVLRVLLDVHPHPGTQAPVPESADGEGGPG